MKHTLTAPWIKLKRYLDQADCDAIHTLYKTCVQQDSIALKLELEYKLANARCSTDQDPLGEVNEFMVFDQRKLIGYLGICGFGNAAAPLELAGMVHPDYRRQGVWTRLHTLVMDECRRRNTKATLGLCDRRALHGHCFLQSIGAAYVETEYEMIFSGDAPLPGADALQELRFQKATNADAAEIVRQNTIYFEREQSQIGEEPDEHRLLLPEDEEKRGMTIYLAFRKDRIIGKIHLVYGDTGAIYGLGVLPEYRGKGYGRAILLTGMQMLMDKNSARIMLQVSAGNETALNLYKSCGFAQTSAMDYYKLI